MTPVGLPHSGIHGSKPAYDSPWHFAVNRALHRLLAPRHPPYALSIFTSCLSTCMFYSEFAFQCEFFRLLLVSSLYAVFKEQGRSGCHRSQGWREVTKARSLIILPRHHTIVNRFLRQKYSLGLGFDGLVRLPSLCGLAT